MALPLLAMLGSTLASKGVELLGDLISNGTDQLADKAVELVKDKTGIDLTAKKEPTLTAEELKALKEFEMNYKMELEKLALENKKEDNRHEEKYEELKVSDKQNARGASHLHEMQTETAKKVYDQTKVLIPVLLIADVLLSFLADYLSLDTAIVVGVSNLIGIAINNAFRERQTIMEFLFGSSIGSKEKDK